MAKNNYKLLEKAKLRVSIDETSPNYGAYLYLAIRSVCEDIKRCITIVIADSISNNYDIRFDSLFLKSDDDEDNDNDNDNDIFDEKMRKGNDRLIKKLLDDLDDNIKLPETKMGSLIWIEAITQGPVNSLESKLKKIQRKVFPNDLQLPIPESPDEEAMV